MRTFYLQRDVDSTGMTGTGVVAEGVQFSDGRCVMRWTGVIDSIVHHKSIADVTTIHGHDGKTKVRWVQPFEVDSDKLRPKQALSGPLPTSNDVENAADAVRDAFADIIDQLEWWQMSHPNEPIAGPLPSNHNVKNAADAVRDAFADLVDQLRLEMSKPAEPLHKAANN